MMRLTRIAATVAGIAAVALTASLAGCSASPSAEDSAVELVIGNQPAASQTAELALFTEQVAAFKKLHPKWKITTSETGWDSQTFQAKLAGGDLPTVIGVPFTEMAGLIKRGQVADITSSLDKAGVKDELNATMVDLAGANGKTYGIPTSAYALGLAYNRDLFTQAGLDPENPPATWDEVRAAAKTIAEKTGQTGFSQLTKDNMGGWILTAETYTRGGEMENAAGTKATFDSAPTKDALAYLKDLRWTDDSMGANALVGISDIAQDFAAGHVGMFVIQSDAFGTLTQQLKMAPEAFGFATLPTEKSGDDPITLSGGNIEIVNPKATDAQKEAAVDWIKYVYLDKYTDKASAVKAAEAAAAQGAPVAIPGLSAVSDAKYTQYLDWVSGVNNVPVENFTPYLDRAAKQTVKAEPVANAQDVYAALDPVVQAVLTDKNADIDALLKSAATTVQSKLGR